MKTLSANTYPSTAIVDELRAQAYYGIYQVIGTATDSNGIAATVEKALTRPILRAYFLGIKVIPRMASLQDPHDIEGQGLRHMLENEFPSGKGSYEGIANVKPGKDQP